MNFLFKIITKITFLGKLVEKLGPKVPIIFIFISLIFIAFYIPHEYENILEFTNKYPNDKIGLTLNLFRPIIISFILLILIVASFKAVNEQKRKLIEEEIERQKKAADLLAKKEEALRKITELKNSSITKTTEKIVSKKTVGAIGGSVIGATLGGSLGIAGKFLGTMVFINGAWVLAPIGGLLGYIAVKKINKKKEEKEEHKKIKEYAENINNQSRNKKND
tara:strand:+ start:1095 stop:1757 length:663 start_codon:yes stop_codon:yes gene_type:complete